MMPSYAFRELTVESESCQNGKNWIGIEIINTKYYYNILT